MPEKNAMGTITMLETQGLTIAFGGLLAVNDVDLTIHEGEILGMIGPNGAGKTTFFNLVTGFLNPTGGKVIFQRRDITGFSPSRIAALGICRTFQITSVFPALTVWQNLLTGTYCWTRNQLCGTFFRTKAYYKQRVEMEREIENILDFLDIEDRRDTFARNLSYGDQRRLEIGIALASRRQLLLLDEPAAGMNPEETQTLMEVIQKIQKKGITVFLIEHHMQLVMGICDRIVVLNNGRKIGEGKPSEISRDPQVIEAYLGSEEEYA
jgi:branched-chain amino acid transport system ATP-binding protein